MTEPQKMGSVDDGFKSSALDALRCLYIAVDSSIADDVNKRVMRYTDKLNEQIRTIIADRDALAQRVKELEGAVREHWLQDPECNARYTYCAFCQMNRQNHAPDCIVRTIKESK